MRIVTLLMAVSLIAGVATAQDTNPTVPIPTSTATPSPTATATSTPRPYVTATPNGVATLDTINIPLPDFNAPSTVTPISYANSNVPAVSTAAAQVTAMVGQTNNLLATITAIAVTPMTNLDGSAFNLDTERIEFRQNAIQLFSILKSIDWDLFGKISILFYATVTSMLIVASFNSAMTLLMIVRGTIGTVWNVFLKIYHFIRSLIPVV